MPFRNVLCFTRAGSLLPTVVAFTLPHVARRRVQHADCNHVYRNKERSVGAHREPRPIREMNGRTGVRFGNRVFGDNNSSFRSFLHRRRPRFIACVSRAFHNFTFLSESQTPAVPGRRKRSHLFCGRFLCVESQLPGPPGRRKRSPIFWRAVPL